MDAEAHQVLAAQQEGLAVSVDALITRLGKLKKTGKDKWIACCPAHEDRSPSLSVKETADGTVLVKCFAGCSVDDICGAIGIEVSELFPPRDGRDYVTQEKPVKFGTVGDRFSAIDALRALAGEGGVLCLFACDMAEGKVLSPDEIERCHTATIRLLGAMEYLNPNLVDE
jgi:hypothetical protein